MLGKIAVKIYVLSLLTLIFHPMCLLLFSTASIFDRTTPLYFAVIIDYLHILMNHYLLCHGICHENLAFFINVSHFYAGIIFLKLKNWTCGPIRASNWLMSKKIKKQSTASNNSSVKKSETFIKLMKIEKWFDLTRKKKLRQHFVVRCLCLNGKWNKIKIPLRTASLLGIGVLFATPATAVCITSRALGMIAR